MFLTRIARLYDSAHLADLWRTASVAHRRVTELPSRLVAPSVGNEARHQQRILNCLAQPKTFAVLGEDDGELVAMALVMPTHTAGDVPPEASSRRAHVSMLAVRPDRWGQGLGSATLETVQVIAGEQGVTQLQLWTQEANPRMHRLCERQGWHISERIRIDKHDGMIRRYIRNL